MIGTRKLRKQIRKRGSVPYMCVESLTLVGEEKLKAIMTAPVFYLDEDVRLSFYDDQDGLSGTVEAMVEAGVYRLPANPCIIEHPVKLADGRTVHNLIFAEETDTEVRIMPVSVLRANFSDVGPLDVALASPVHPYRSKLSGERGIWEAEGCVIDESMMSDPAPGGGMEALARCALVDMETMLVLLSTRGVSVERTSVLKKGKRRLRRRDAASYEYHKVVVPGLNSAGDGETQESTEPRRRVRLHIRRGHVRRQRCGKGNAEETVIWINPVLVGYEEEGRVYKDYVVKQTP